MKKLTELPKQYKSWRDFYNQVKEYFNQSLVVFINNNTYLGNIETFEITELELLRFVANEETPNLLTEQEYKRICAFIYWSAGSSEVENLTNKLRELTDFTVK